MRESYIAQKTLEPMVAKVSRLYEQGADEVRIETYLKHWWRWVRSGVDLVARFPRDNHLVEQYKDLIKL